MLDKITNINKTEYYPTPAYQKQDSASSIQSINYYKRTPLTASAICTRTDIYVYVVYSKLNTTEIYVMEDNKVFDGCCEAICNM